jgi:DNA-binding XRE family transcriptional regulator
MEIKTANDLDQAAVTHLRKELGLTQKAFWEPLGITQSAGCRYEAGQPVPKPIRILVFASHVAGLRMDACTLEGAEQLRRLGRLQASEAAANAEKLGATMTEAIGAMRQAQELLAQIPN